MAKGEFSVIQYLVEDVQEKVREFVDAEEAIDAFRHYTNNVASRMGITKRVILIDGEDCVNMEWEFGKGIVFPLPEHYEAAERGESEFVKPSDILKAIEEGKITLDKEDLN